MTIKISLQFNGRVNVSPWPARCSLSQHCILVAWLVPAVFHSSVDRWSRAGWLLPADPCCSMGLHLAISPPQETWKGTPRLAPTKLPQQPPLACFVWCLSGAKPGAQRWALFFSFKCVFSFLWYAMVSFSFSGASRALHASLIPSKAAQI